MLHGAPAADAEMRADRCDAIGARLVDAQEVATVRMAGNLFDFNAPGM